MPQRTVANITLVTVSASDNGIALSQTPSGAGNLTLAGALTSGGVYTATDAAHLLIIKTVADETARTFTITGTDANGVAQTEAITGVNNNTVNSTKFYKTVTKISVDGATAGAIVVGITNSIVTPPILINTRTSGFAVSNAFIISGTINYDLQHTFDNVMLTPVGLGIKPEGAITWFADATITGQTGNKAANLALPVHASRLIVNSYSTGATIRWNIVEVYGP